MCFELPSWQPPCTNGTFIAKPSKHDRKVKKAVDSLKAEKEVQEAVKAMKPKRESVPAAVSMFVWERDGGCCLMCGKGATDTHPDGKPVKIHEDHVFPVAQGGKSVEENMCLLCDRHNLAKGAKRMRLLEVIVQRHRDRQEGKPVVVPDPPPPKPALTPEAIKWQEEKAGEKKLIEIAELGAKNKKGGE